MIEAFKQAIPIIEEIEEAGFEAYFVGGSVRDYLLNKDNDDVDIATSATPHEIKQIFSKTVDVGIEHGTVLVLYGEQSYEITTFRSESEYEDFRRPKAVQFIRSLYEDLKRRDFTMNAIAMNQKGELIDPFAGHEAIKNKVIRTVGNAEERFSEDALRIMRAIRFVSQLSFMIEEGTFMALREKGPLLQNISIERKTKEFEKLLCGPNRRTAMNILIEADLLDYLPGLTDKGIAIKKMVSSNCEALDVIDMWAFLLFTLDVSSTNSNKFLKKWKLSNQKIKVVEKILFFIKKRISSPWSELSLFQAGEDIMIRTEKIYNVVNNIPVNEQVDFLKNWYHSLPIKNRGELSITGQDLMNWKDEPGGPWVKKLLDMIEEGVLLEKVSNEKEAIREWLFTCNQI